MSIVVPTYNRLHLLDTTLTALTRQTADVTTWEVIVADDGSTDDVEQLVARWRSTINVALVRRERDGHRPAAARNLGARSATVEWLLFLDCGVALARDALQNLIENLEEGAVVLGAVDGYDPDHSESSRPEASARDPRTHALGDSRVSMDFLRVPWAYAWSLLLALPTSVFRQEGGFDERFEGWGMEDIDLGYRVHRRGARFVWDPAVKGIDHPHERNTVQNLLSNRRNQLRFLRHHWTKEAELFVYARRNWLDLEQTFRDYAEFQWVQASEAPDHGLAKSYMAAAESLDGVPTSTLAISPSCPSELLEYGWTVLDPHHREFTTADLDLYGVCTPWEDKHFGVAFVGSGARRGPAGYYPAVLAEARRIATIVVENAED